MRTLLIMLLAATIVGVPQADSQGKSRGTTAESSAIEGRVLNSATDEPLRNVDLILRRSDVSPNTHSPASYTMSTDGSGRFAIRHVEPGQYRLLAARSGFVSVEYGSRGQARAGATLSIDAGRPLQNIVFRLTPHAVVAGRLTDADGEPVANIQVQAMRYSYVHGQKQLSSFGRASTSDLGEYRIVGLAPGRYYLSASYGTPVIFNETAAEDYVATYYPGTADATLAVPIDATAGSELRSADFALAKTRTVRIRGHVASLNGNGKSMVTVMLASADQSGARGQNRTYVTDPQGEFDIRGVAPGTYTLVASIFDGGAYTTAKKPLDATNNVDDFTVTVTPGLEVRGSIRVEGNAKPNLTDVRISLLPFEAGEVWSPLANTQVKEDGTFTLSNVSSDNYNMTVFELPDGYYVKSIRIGNDEVMDGGGLNLREPAGPINIVLSPGAAQIEGAVLSVRQQTALGATVVLVPQDEKRRNQPQFYGVTTTDQYGRFTLKNVYPGRYKVFAWEDLEYDAFIDPDFVKPVEDKAESLTIQENAHARIQLKLIQAEVTNQR